MPISIGSMFRVFIGLVLSAWVFGMYSTARTMSDVVGFDAGTIVGSAIFALIMLVPFTPAAGLPDLPELIGRGRGARRWRRGLCPGCGYDLAGLARETCPECATPLVEPAAVELGLRTLRRFLVISVLAWGLGSVAAEGWIAHDEQSFAGEVRERVSAGRDTPYARPRRWPSGSSSLVYVPGQGVHGTCH